MTEFRKLEWFYAYQRAMKINKEEDNYCMPGVHIKEKAICGG